MIKERNLLYVLVSSAVVTAAWVGFSLYHTAITSTLDPELTAQIQPIAPQFNSQSIQRIQARKETIPSYQLTGVSPAKKTASQAGQLNRTPSISPVPSVRTPVDEENSL